MTHRIPAVPFTPKWHGIPHPDDPAVTYTRIICSNALSAPVVQDPPAPWGDHMTSYNELERRRDFVTGLYEAGMLSNADYDTINKTLLSLHESVADKAYAELREQRRLEGSN